MPKDRPHFALVLSWAVIVSIALLIVGCGSGGSNSSALTQAQAQAIATAVSNGIQQAFAGTFGVPSVTRSSDAMHPVEAAADAATPPACLPSFAGQTCTWPVSATFSCPGGGTMAVSGEITASLSTTGSGSAQVQIAAVPASCSVNGVVLNGAPQVNVAGQMNVLNDMPEWPVTSSETGAVSYGPHPSGTCQLNLTYTVTSNLSCTVSGTACGQSVSGSC
jgi:hypothetical protein